MTNGWWFIAMAFATLCGALNINFAIHHFKSKHYFRFGFWAMMVVYEIVLMIKWVFAI